MHFYYCDPLSRQNAKWFSNAIESQSNAIESQSNAIESIERNRISIEPIESQSNLKIGVIFDWDSIAFDNRISTVRLRSIGSIAEPVRLTSSGYNYFFYFQLFMVSFYQDLIVATAFLRAATRTRNVFVFCILYFFTVLFVIILSRLTEFVWWRVYWGLGIIPLLPDLRYLFYGQHNSVICGAFALYSMHNHLVTSFTFTKLRIAGGKILHCLV